jgi:hypothetical protein
MPNSSAKRLNNADRRRLEVYGVDIYELREDHHEFHEHQTMWIYSMRHPTAVIRKTAYRYGRILEEWQVHEGLGTCSSTVCEISMPCGST